MPKQCRNSWQSGCRCRECHIGLAEYNPALLATTTLHVVTMPTKPEPHDPNKCDRMVCPEPVCIARNANTPPQGSGNADPFRRAA